MYIGSATKRLGVAMPNDIAGVNKKRKKDDSQGCQNTFRKSFVAKIKAGFCHDMLLRQQKAMEELEM